MTNYRPRLWTGLTAVALLSTAALGGCETYGYDHYRHGRYDDRGDRGERGERGERGDHGDRDDHRRGDRRW